MSDNYILFTDSGADIPPSLLSEWGVGYQPLTFRFDHIDKEFSNDEMDIREFYRLMREGHIAKTSAVASYSRILSKRYLPKAKTFCIWRFPPDCPPPATTGA